MQNEPWLEFKTGSPSTQPRWNNTNCLPFDTLFHVAHIPTAIQIVKDGRIKSDLIFDKSILNTERIRVAWLSPNTWNPGYRYGNVRFHFSIQSLIIGRHAYWVESIAYGVAACRILITDKDYSNTLTIYDPNSSNGPWRILEDGKHYYNSNHCLEIMVESDLPLTNLTDIDFVDHHPEFCNIDYRTCKYKGKLNWQVGSEFIAALASNGSPYDYNGFIHQDGTIRQSNIHLQYSIREIVRLIKGLPIIYSTTTPLPDALLLAVARSILTRLYDTKLFDDVIHLGSLFTNQESLINVIQIIIADTFCLPDPNSLYE